jgi:hypothetical protein
MFCWVVVCGASKLGLFELKKKTAKPIFFKTTKNKEKDEDMFFFIGFCSHHFSPNQKSEAINCMFLGN